MADSVAVVGPGVASPPPPVAGSVAGPTVMETGAAVAGVKSDSLTQMLLLPGVVRLQQLK